MSDNQNELEQLDREALICRVRALEEENAFLSSADEKLITVADYLGAVMKEKNIENFNASKLSFEGKTMELICRFTDKKTVADVMTEQREMITTLEDKLRSAQKVIKQMVDTGELGEKSRGIYKRWVD